HVYPGFGDSEPALALDLGAYRQMASDAGTAPGFGRTPRSAAPAWRQLVLVEPPGRCGSDLASRLDRAVAGLVIRAPDAVRARALDIFDQTFVLTRALTLLALLVAAVGVYNAVLALRLRAEPARRLLAAVGASRAETRGVGLVRALVVGGLAVLLALPLGGVMAWILCAVVNPRAFGWTIELGLAGRAWFEPLLLGLGATLLAALLPAPREQGAGDLDA
ncbi:MAG: FtsX-like permease family protein, partial [Gammaproteobacteria bacterium]